MQYYLVLLLLEVELDKGDASNVFNVEAKSVSDEW